MSPSSPAVLSVDRVVPTIGITSPGGGNVSGTITLSANAADNDAIASVQFRVDGTVLGSVSAAPFQISWNTAGVANGAHTIYATATDRVGNQTTTSVAINVANLPAINFYAPGNGATINGNVGIGAYVTQYSSGVSVWFYIDGSNIYGVRSGTGYYTTSYDTHNLAVGWHTFTCIAQDDNGNQSRVDYGCYVNNSPPAAGTTMLGDHCYWEDDGGYWSNYRHTSPDYDGTQGNWIWSGTGAKFTPVYLPGNPDPGHYQMRVWCHVERIEGGSDGNIQYLDFQIGGVVGWTNVWANGPAYTNIGPLWNVGGGNDCYAKWWGSWAGNNTCFCIGIGFYYDFVPRYAS